MNKDWVADLQEELARFARDRDWQEYHTPRNLAALIASEAGELLALFRWGQNALAETPDAVQKELADVFLGVLRFADQAGFDLEQVSREKIETNATNYPAAPKDTVPDRPRESVEPVDRLPVDLLEQGEYLADLSLLGLLPAVGKNTTLTLIVPETLDQLLTAPSSPERDAIIRSVGKYREGRGEDLSSQTIGNAESSQSVALAYQELKGLGRIRAIPDMEASPEIRQALAGLVRETAKDPAFQINGQRFSRPLVIRRHIATILEYSRQTGTAILMRGRQLISRLAGRLTTLELPSKVDRLVAKKSESLGKAFDFTGGKAARLFIGVVTTLLGPLDPVSNAVGVVLVVIDP